MASELKGMRLGGREKIVEIDGDYFGGYVKPSNRLENRRDRRLAKNQNGKRRSPQFGSPSRPRWASSRPARCLERA